MADLGCVDLPDQGAWAVVSCRADMVTAALPGRNWHAAAYPNRARLADEVEVYVLPAHLKTRFRAYSLKQSPTSYSFTFFGPFATKDTVFRSAVEIKLFYRK
jgi:hypothetical protein